MQNTWIHKTCIYLFYCYHYLGILIGFWTILVTNLKRKFKIFAFIWIIKNNIDITILIIFTFFLFLTMCRPVLHAFVQLLDQWTLRSPRMILLHVPCYPAVWVPKKKVSPIVLLKARVLYGLCKASEYNWHFASMSINNASQSCKNIPSTYELGGGKVRLLTSKPDNSLCLRVVRIFILSTAEIRLIC